MSNIPFIKSDERILIVYESGDDFGFKGPISNVLDVVEKIDRTEGVIKVCRIDLKNLHMEDVSDEVANCFLTYRNINLACEHPFVENSFHYQNLIDDLEHEERVDLEYSTYEQQNRLHASQML